MVLLVMEDLHLLYWFWLFSKMMELFVKNAIVDNTYLTINNRTRISRFAWTEAKIMVRLRWLKMVMIWLFRPISSCRRNFLILFQRRILFIQIWLLDAVEEKSDDQKKRYWVSSVHQVVSTLQKSAFCFLLRTSINLPRIFFLFQCSVENWILFDRSI